VNRRAARAAKAATTTIPVVFTRGDDPIQIGLVSSLNRPGANVTGVSILFSEIQAKRLELLRDLIPTVRTVGFVFDPETPREDIEPTARGLGLQLYERRKTILTPLSLLSPIIGSRRFWLERLPGFSPGRCGLSDWLPARPCRPFTKSADTSPLGA
jgi:ABC transporter substrate binding protein